MKRGLEIATALTAVGLVAGCSEATNTNPPLNNEMSYHITDDDPALNPEITRLQERFGALAVKVITNGPPLDFQFNGQSYKITSSVPTDAEAQQAFLTYTTDSAKRSEPHAFKPTGSGFTRVHAAHTVVHQQGELKPKSAHSLEAENVYSAVGAYCDLLQFTITPDIQQLPIEVYGTASERVCNSLAEAAANAQDSNTFGFYADRVIATNNDAAKITLPNGNQMTYPIISATQFSGFTQK